MEYRGFGLALIVAFLTRPSPVLGLLPSVARRQLAANSPLTRRQLPAWSNNKAATLTSTRLHKKPNTYLTERATHRFFFFLVPSGPVKAHGYGAPRRGGTLGRSGGR